MANITIKRYNGSAWDIHYPKTIISQVVNLSTTLANMQDDIDGKLASNGKAADSDKLDGLDSTQFIKENDTIMNTNPFGGRRLFINNFNNAMYLADKRFTVTATGGSGLNNAFNGNYENGYYVAPGTSQTITIDFGGSWPGYGYGYILLSFYYKAVPASVTGRVYCNYEPHGLGWHNITFSPLTGTIGNGGNNLVLSARQGKHAISKIEITINARDEPTSSYNYTRLTSIDWKLDRPGSNSMPALDKYTNQDMYYDLNFPDSGKPRVAGQEVYHPGNKPTPAAIGAAAASHNHSATNITSGRLILSRLPTGLAGTVLKGNDLNDPVWGSISWSEIQSKPSVIIEGDSRLTNARPASDVYSWAKASSKPSYTAAEVGAAAASHNHTKSQITDFPSNIIRQVSFSSGTLVVEVV